MRARRMNQKYDPLLQICISRVSEGSKCCLCNKCRYHYPIFCQLNLDSYIHTYEEQIIGIHWAEMHLNQKQVSYPDFAFSSSASTFLLRDSSIPVVSSSLPSRFSFSSVFFMLTSFSWSVCVGTDSNKFFLLP